MILAQSSFAQELYYYNDSKKVTLTPIQTSLRTLQNIDYYENERGLKLGVSDKLILKLSDNTNLQFYLQEYNMSIESTLSTDVYLLKLQNKNLTLSISNMLSEKEDVIYAHPDFIKQREMR